MLVARRWEMADPPDQSLAFEIASLQDRLSELSERAKRVELLAARGEMLRSLLGLVTAPIGLDRMSHAILALALDGGTVADSGSIFIALPTGERKEAELFVKAVLTATGKVVPDTGVTEFPRFFEGVEGEGIVGYVLATGDGYVAADCDSDPIYKRFTGPEQLGSLMAQPLKYGDNVIGVVSVHSTGRRVEYTKHDQEFVRALADVGSVVVGANYDRRTMLPNLHLMDDLVKRAIASAEKNGRPLSLAYIDIDDFGELNDDHGHAAADEVLSRLARVMADEVGQKAILCHRHGDEFAIIFRDENLHEARETTERIRGRVEKETIDVEGRRMKVKISGGVAPWETGLTARQLTDRADKANRAAKAAGKNCVKCHEN